MLPYNILSRVFVGGSSPLDGTYVRGRRTRREMEREMDITTHHDASRRITTHHETAHGQASDAGSCIYSLLQSTVRRETESENAIHAYVPMMRQTNTP